MFRIPRVLTSVETMREICEELKLGVKSVEELAEKLGRSETTIKQYLNSMKRFKLIGRNGTGYELLEAGKVFVELAGFMSAEEALHRAIVEYGDVADIRKVLKHLDRIKPVKRSHLDFVKSWKIFLKKLKLIDEEGKLTACGEALLRSEVLEENLLRNPSLLARKIAFCPGYEFQESDPLPKAVQHDLEMILVEEKLKEMGFRNVSVKLKYGIPDGVLVKDGRIYIHEHKTGRLDKSAYIQALLYAKAYEEEYGELPGIVLTNLEDVKVYESEEIRESMKALSKVLKTIVKKIIARDFTPGPHCSYCGNSNCLILAKNVNFG